MLDIGACVQQVLHAGVVAPDDCGLEWFARVAGVPGGSPADDAVGERNQRGQAEEAGDEDPEDAVLQHGDKTAPGQQQRGEITADDEEELHAEAMDGGVEPVEGPAGPAVHDHPRGAAQGQ